MSLNKIACFRRIKKVPFSNMSPPKKKKKTDGSRKGLKEQLVEMRKANGKTDVDERRVNKIRHNQGFIKQVGEGFLITSPESVN